MAIKSFLCSDGVWECWTPLTHAGSISLAQSGGEKARWCTAYTNNDYYFNYYTQGNRGGPLYIFLNTSNPEEKYQLHFESNSWFDIEDNSLGMDQFYEFISDKPAFLDYFKVDDIDGIKCRLGVVVGMDKDLSDIIIPADIESIDLHISWPKGVTSIIFPDHWEELKCPPLYGMLQLEYVHLPNNLRSIPYRCFMNCSALEKVDMPDNLNTILGQAFYNCEILSNLDIPNTIEKIGPLAFANTMISNFRFPDSMNELTSKNIFGNLSYMRTIDLNNITKLGVECLALDDISNAEGTITIIGMENLKRIKSYAFRNCNINKITLADDVYIGNGVFKGCSYAKGSITLTESMKIGLEAFDDCPELEIVWARPDENYEFDNIKKLICSNACTQLIEANKGYIPIETIEGETYDAEV